MTSMGFTFVFVETLSSAHLIYPLCYYITFVEWSMCTIFQTQDASRNVAEWQVWICRTWSGRFQFAIGQANNYSKGLQSSGPRVGCKIVDLGWSTALSVGFGG